MYEILWKLTYKLYSRYKIFPRELPIIYVAYAHINRTFAREKMKRTPNDFVIKRQFAHLYVRKYYESRFIKRNKIKKGPAAITQYTGGANVTKILFAARIKVDDPIKAGHVRLWW